MVAIQSNFGQWPYKICNILEDTQTKESLQHSPKNTPKNKFIKKRRRIVNGSVENKFNLDRPDGFQY